MACTYRNQIWERSSCFIGSSNTDYTLKLNFLYQCRGVSTSQMCGDAADWGQCKSWFAAMGWIVTTGEWWHRVLLHPRVVCSPLNYYRSWKILAYANLSSFNDYMMCLWHMMCNEPYLQLRHSIKWRKEWGYFVQGSLRGVVFRYLNVYVLQQQARLGLYIQLENRCM